MAPRETKAPKKPQQVYGWDMRGPRKAKGVECGCSSTVELQPSKLVAWVRFPSPAPQIKTCERVAGQSSRQQGRCLESNTSLPPPVADEGKRGGVIASKASGAIPITRSKFYGRLAQLVEHLTLNQGVQGSSP